MIRFGLSAILLTLFQGIILSQGDTMQIQEVTISENRISLGYKDQTRQVQIITKSEIAKAPVRSLAELLQYVSGVDIRRRGPLGVQADIAIRGGNFEQTLILLNGIRMNDAQTGHHNLYIPVDISKIERIEIVKGGASRIYGQNAFSGVINIITKVSDETSVAGDLDYASFGTFYAGLVTELPQHSLSLSYQSSDGYRYNTDSKIFNAFYQSSMAFLGQNIKWMGGFTERKFGANGFYASESYKDQYEEVQTSIIAATTNVALGDKTILTPKLSWRRNQDMYLFVRDNPALYRNLHIGNTLSAEVHLSHQNDLGTLGLGIDIAQQALRSNNLGNHLRSVIGLFAEQHFALWNEKISATVGLYTQYTGDRKDKIKFYPGLDMGYSVSKRSKIFASMGLSNRLPSYTDLYYSSPAEQGNPDLVDESAWDAQLGTSYQHQFWKLDCTLFHKSASNAIDWGKDSLSQAKWLVTNLSGLKTNGIEIGMTAQLHRRVEGRLQYTWLDLQQHNPSNQISRFVINNLRHQILGSITSKWLADKLHISVFSRYNERISTSSLSQLDGFGHHFILDAQIKYQWSRFMVGISINNITDTAYRETNLVPMPGRWIHCKVSYRWNKK